MSIIKTISGVFIFDQEDPAKDLVPVVLPEEDAMWSIIIFADYDMRPVYRDNDNIQSLEEFQKERKLNGSYKMCEKYNLPRDEYIKPDGFFNSAKYIKNTKLVDRDLVKEWKNNGYSYIDHLESELDSEHDELSGLCCITKRELLTNISSTSWCKNNSAPLQILSQEILKPTFYMVDKSNSIEARTLSINISDSKIDKRTNILGYSVQISYPPKNEKALSVELTVRNLTIFANKIG